MTLAALTSSLQDEGERRSPSRSSSPALSARLGFLTRPLRCAVLSRLRNIQGGQILLRDGSPQDKVEPSPCNGLSAAVSVRDPRFYRRVALGGGLGAAQSYLDGDWDCDDLVSLFRIFARNLESAAAVDSRVTMLTRSAARLGHWLVRNTRRGSRKNIEAHYDLGDEFFRLFLDSTMMYSSAIFESEQASLEQAQVARLDRICRKLDLRPSDHVLEIGAGWGGFALHAARNYGCRVTTTTISRNQFETAGRRVRDAGLNDRVALLDRDYRDLRGKYDKIVSIEMIEAVGHKYFDEYFGKCGALLKADGRMLLQAIVIPERRFKKYLRSVDFIQKYIFPGGCLPSITAMQQSVARRTSLRLLELEDFGPHYAETLRRWRARFHDQLDKVRRLGYSHRFIRMWDYYLCYCEAAFEERAIGAVHAVWGR